MIPPGFEPRGGLPFLNADVRLASAVACIAIVGTGGIQSRAHSVQARTAADSIASIDTGETHAAGEDVICTPVSG